MAAVDEWLADVDARSQATGGYRRVGSRRSHPLLMYNAVEIGIMVRPSGKPLLGEVEQLVVLAVLRLGNEAYAVPIRTLIEQDAGVDLSRGTIYVTLDRLEQKGYVESWFSDPQSVRGGKARRMFRLKPAGLTAIRAAKHALDRLAAGTVIERPLPRKA